MVGFTAATKRGRRSGLGQTTGYESSEAKRERHDGPTRATLETDRQTVSFKLDTNVGGVVVFGARFRGGSRGF